MNGILSDIRFALRQLVAKPGFTAAAIATLALGIGANVAVFSLLNGYFLEPLPYPQGGRLVELRTQLPKFYGVAQPSPSVVMYEAIRAHVPALSAVVADSYAPFSLEVNGGARYVAGAAITGNMFRTLGIEPLLGRALTAQDNRPGQTPVAVISYRLWKSVFDGNKNVLGRSVKLNGGPYRIVGVMPRGFSWDNGHTDIWVPRSISPAQKSASNTFNSWLGTFIGRLKPGASRKALKSQLAYLRHRLLEALPENVRKKYADSGFHFVVTPYRQAKLEGEGAHTTLTLLLLQAAVLFLLLLTCANVANLVLARTLGRGHELAMRRALGATRRFMIRQLLVEGVCLALPGGLIGLGLGWLCVHVLAGSPMNPGVSIFTITPNWRVGLFVLAAIGFVTVLVSVLPALYVAKSDLKRLLQQGSHGTGRGRTGGRARSLLVVVQITLATALLAGAGLLVHSFVNLQNTRVGFNPNHVLAMRLLGKHQSKAASATFRSDILRRVQALPGVEHAAMASWIPLNDFFGETNFKLQGRSFAAQKPTITYDAVTSGFFRTLQIPILHGRGFEATDTKTSQAVAVIDARFARTLFGKQGAVGQFINLGSASHDKWVRIIGVARPIKLRGLERTPPYEIYLNNRQFNFDYGQGMRLMVRTDEPTGTMVDSIKKIVAKIAPDIAVYGGILHVYSMPDIISHRLQRKQFFMFVVLVFGCIALALSVIGVYGVLSYAVMQRHNEFGVRLALGAMPGSIQRLVLRDGLKLLPIGLVLGLALAVFAGFELRSLLFHVAPWDSVTLIVTAGILGATALLASYLPARRASKLNPSEVILDQ